MELKSLHCPDCGGMVQIPEGKDRFFCTFCGSQIQLDDNSIRLHYYDEAKLKELDLMEQKRLREEKEKAEQEKKQAEQQALEKKKKKTWLIVAASWIIFGTILGAFLEKSTACLVLFCCSLIFVPPFLSLTIPNSFFPPDKPPSVGAKIGIFFLIMMGGGGLMGLIFNIFKAILP